MTIFTVLLFTSILPTALGEIDEFTRRIVSFDADLFPGNCNPFDTYSSQYKICKPYENRPGKVAEAIKLSLMNTDVVCLQGVYYKQDEALILDVNRNDFPYSLSFIHNDKGEFDGTASFPAPCKTKERPSLEILALCSSHGCHSESDNDKFIACMEETCPELKDLFSNLTDNCLGCIAGGTKRNALDCLRKEYAFNPTGLLLLSKSKILSFDRKYFPHDHEIIRHGYLDTQIEGIGRVICSVLQPYIGKEYIDITSDTSYEEKNLNEAKFLVEATRNSDDVIIAGCLNTSPSLTKGAIVPQFVNSLGWFKMAGFRDPVSDSYYGSYPSCTFCFSNGYVKDRFKMQYYDGYILDHVLVKGFKARSSATRHKLGTNKNVFRVLMSEVDNEFQPLSAHFGVSVDFEVGNMMGQK